MQIAIVILQVIFALVLILSVMFQSGSKEGLGTLAGSSDAFASKNKTSTRDEKLSKVTIVSGILFVVASVALNIVSLAK